MEVQEQAINKETVRASLLEVFPVEDIPEDWKEMLQQLEGFEYCREVALDSADCRLRRLLGNTANQIAK